MAAMKAPAGSRLVELLAHGRWHLPVATFTCGAATMALEMVGSRALAPFVGSSTVVWSCIIGVVLGSLSLGYSWGGRLADRQPAERTLAAIIALAAVLSLAAAVLHRPLLRLAVALVVDIETAALVGSTLLLALPSVLLGAVFPYAVRLRLREVASGGATTGSLTSISTLGSLAGTFFSGFWLIPSLGTTRSFACIGVALLVASLLLVGREWGRAREVGLVVAAIAVAGFGASAAELPVTVETRYGTYSVAEAIERSTDRPMRYLVLGRGEVQSAVYIDGQPGLASPYTRYYRLARHFRPNLQRALMLGGGAYAYPADFLASYATATLDVVEVDPGVTALARQYFGLTDDPRLTIYHEDARTFLNRAAGPYDATFGDVFTSTYAPPFHLTTLEAVQQMYASLAEGGVAIVNVVSAFEGPASEVLRAQLATFREVFPYVYVLTVSEERPSWQLQNIILVAVRSATPPSLESADPELAGYLSHLRWAEVSADLPPLTDDRAPIERYVRHALRLGW